MSNPYEAACVDANLRPRKSIIEAYEEAASQGVETGVELKCSGRTLAEGRMLDVDMKLLSEAMLKAHPFERLDLSFNELGGESGGSLKSLLEGDTQLRSLDLTGNSLTPAPCKEIFKGLEKNSALRELRLSSNQLGDEAGMQLAELLQVNDTLQRLHLANCDLKMPSLVGLATVLQQNTAVTVLDVQRSLVSSPMEEHVEHFGRLLAVSHTLQELDLSKVHGTAIHNPNPSPDPNPDPSPNLNPSPNPNPNPNPNSNPNPNPYLSKCHVSDRGLLMLASSLRKAGGNSALRALRLRSNQIRLVDEGAIDVLGLLLSSEE